MRIRLALTLSIDRDREQQPNDESREVDMGSLVDHAERQHDAPRIGFRSIEEES
jgi:hypothetical protein